MAGLIGAMCATNLYADISTLIFFFNRTIPLNPVKTRRKVDMEREREREKIREKKQRRIIPWRAGGLAGWRWVVYLFWPFRLRRPNTLSTAFLECFLASLLPLVRDSDSSPYSSLPRFSLPSSFLVLLLPQIPQGFPLVSASLVRCISRILPLVRTF